MGICGTAMGNAAVLARAAGHEVLGADAGIYPPMSTVRIGGYTPASAPSTSWPAARASSAALPIAVPQMPMK